MSLLSYTELIELIETDVITADVSLVNSSSIDITLGNQFYIEQNTTEIADLSKRESSNLDLTEIRDHGHGIVLQPGEFILAHSREIFNLPNNISAEYKLKSSLARSGLDHLNAGWCDASWHGSVLTLELKNCLRYQSLRLVPGMKIGQMIFFKHKEVPDHASYATKGSYNRNKTVTTTQGNLLKGMSRNE